MNVPKDLRYTKEHEWIRQKGGEVEVGITEYAQGELGDVIFVDLPPAGTKVGAMKAFGSFDAVKTVSDIFAPVAGEIVAINTSLKENPALVNQSPYGEGWMVRIRVENPADVTGLLSAEDYEKHLGAHA
jgi:glycine cleavage system H protein